MLKRKISIINAIAIIAFVSSCNSLEEIESETAPLSNEITQEKLGGYELIPLEEYDFSLSANIHPQYGILGHGYDVTQNYATQDGFSNRPMVIDVTKIINSSNSGLLFTTNVNQQYNRVSYGENALSITNKRKLETNATVNIPAFGGMVGAKFNNKLSFNNQYSSKDIYGIVEMKFLKKSVGIIGDFNNFNAPEITAIRNNHLSTTFVNFVLGNSAQAIVENFGTHVMVDIRLGASFDLNWKAETLQSNREIQSEQGMGLAVPKFVDVSLGINVSSSVTNNNFNQTMRYRTRGGNESSVLVGEINFNNSTPISKINLSSWIASQTDANSVLIDFNPRALVPIHYFINDLKKRNLVIDYVNTYLNQGAIKLVDEKVSVERYYSAAAFNHLYVTNPNAENLTGYVYNSKAFDAYLYRVPNTFPVYRYYNATGANHYYNLATGTTIPQFPGYTLQGLAFYAYSTPGTGRSPIYRAFGQSGALFNHFYTKSFPEYSSAINTATYTGEGIQLYAH